jgi:hypothetical protein
MPSNAFKGHLLPLLIDAEELDAAHIELRTGSPGRQYGLGALNRAAVVMCVSAWEAYIEELVRESLEAIRPPAAPMGAWPALNATARAAIGRFNTPNTDQVRVLIADSIGLQDIQSHWSWRRCSPPQARARLQAVMDYRHAVAHGVNPRPPIHNQYSSQLPDFLRRLGQCTDTAVRTHLVTVLGIPHPWPP